MSDRLMALAEQLAEGGRTAVGEQRHVEKRDERRREEEQHPKRARRARVTPTHELERSHARDLYPPSLDRGHRPFGVDPHRAS